MKNQEQPVNAETILTYLHDHPGMKYSVPVLTKLFNANAQHMNGLLRQLHESHQVESKTGHTQYFFITRPIDTTVPVPSQKARPFKTYVPPKNLGERCAELYPADRGFISVNRNE